MPIRIQERDQYLLELLASDFLLLTREQIQVLIPRGVRRTNQRLALLVDDGYLAKKEPEDTLSPSLTFYYLGENAAGVLGNDAEEVKARRTRAKNFGDSYLRHLHLTNSVHIKFLTTHAPDYQFLNWVPSDNREWGEVRGLRLRPDGFVRFRKGQQEFCYFIEIDRGTERGESIRKKITEYHEFDVSGRFWQSFKREWFRVLFVVSEESHCRTLLKLFPSEAFWVAPAEKMLSQGLFEPHWVSKEQAALSLTRELEPKRKARIDAQREARLHPLPPVPAGRETRQEQLHAVSRKFQEAMMRLWKIFPWLTSLKVCAGIAAGVVAVITAKYFYHLTIEVAQWVHARPSINSDLRLILLSGCLLAVWFLVAMR